MPLHLEPLDVSADLDGHESVLIVSCPVCPPVSLATDKNTPLIEFFKHGIKTGAYEDFIGDFRQLLERRGIKTDEFTSYVPCAATCLWTRGQRNRLLKRAKDCDAAVVMGCESAKCTVEETLKNTNCKVVLGMVRFPFTVKLENSARVSANERVKDAASQRAQ
jgi:hypothetical protein